MKTKYFPPILAGLLCFNLQSTQAAGFVYNLTTYYDIAGSPIQSGGLTATFQDVAGGVDLTLSVSGLGQSYYNVNTWWIMANSTYANTFTFAKQSSTGTFTAPTLNQRATPTSEAGNDGYFNTWLNGWATFENGDSITYLITSTKSGLTSAAFNLLDSPTSGSYGSGGTYYSAAYVNGNSSPPTSSFYIGSTTSSPVPEPTSLALAGLGGLSLLLFRRQRK
jgi:PEP-CTERM motif